MVYKDPISDLSRSELLKLLKKAKKSGQDKISIKAIAEMIGNSRVVKSPKIRKVNVPLVDSGTKTVNSSNSKFGEIVQDTSIFVKVLQTLLESNILLLEKKGIVVDSRLKLLSIDDCLKEIIHFHNNLVRHNRIPFCFTFYKEVTNYCIQLLETPREKHKDVFTPRTSTGVIDRWPTAFQSCRPLFFNARDRSEIGHVCDQILRSLLNVSRLCEDFKDISLESITKPSDPISPEFLKDFEDFVINKFRNNNVIKQTVWNTKLNIDQSKKGPNGTLAYKSSKREAFKLLNSKRFSLKFKNLCELTGNEDLYKYVLGQSKHYEVLLQEAYESRQPSKSKMTFKDFRKEELEEIKLRKLVGIPDSGHKARTIAIVDYWTQTILEPSERHLVQATMKLYPQSCDYFSHSKGFDRMFERLKVGDVFYDCSNWTDRFPVELQEIVHKNMFNSDITRCWLDLVVKCPWVVENSTQTVRYARGQGMGTRGSFQIAQLTSCLLMDYIFVRHYQIKHNNKYWGEVGDDMGCHDPEGHVLETYKFLDIPINLAKTKTSTDENLCMEYVSRNVNLGKDVSRISARNCQALEKNLLDITSLVLHLHERTEVFDYELLFKNLRSLKTSKGNPRWKFRSWEILYKTLVLNNIIYPDEVLGSIAIPLYKALKETTIVNKELILFSDIKIDSDISLLLKIAVLDNICNKIVKAKETLINDHRGTEGNPFPPPDHSLVSAIVDNSLRPEGTPPVPIWNYLPDIDSGCATYQYMHALSLQNYHKFIAEFFGSRILNGEDFSQLELAEKIFLIDQLETELTRILISVTPKQVFGRQNSDYQKTRQRVSYSYSLLRHFSTEEDLDEFRLKFNCELEAILEMKGYFPDNPIVVARSEPE
jgi:hypothetical protein